MYVFNLFNYQSGGISLLFLAFFEVITVSWGYGADRFVGNIEKMVGRKILPWWAFAWKYLSPAVILGMFIHIILSQLTFLIFVFLECNILYVFLFLGVFIFSFYSWKGVQYGTYQYPPIAEFFGWLLALASMLWIPGFAIYVLVKASGSNIREKIRSAFTPDERIADEIEIREGYTNKEDAAIIM